jgi:dihydrofolate reductase
MTRIVLTEFISLDGVIEEPRWTFQFERGPDGGKFKFDELFTSEALLLGRVTYQGFAQAWPSMGRRVRQEDEQHPQVRGLVNAE